MSQNLVEIRVSASSIEAEQAMKRVATVTQDAMNKLKENMAKIRADFGKGFQVETGTMQSSMDRAKRLFDETRTAAERYESKLNELSNQLRNGAIDQDLFNRGLAKAKQELEQANSATAKHETVVGRAMGAVKGLIGAYMGFEAIKGVGKMAEDMQGVNAQIRRTTESEAEFAEVQKRVKDISTETRAGLVETAQLYSRSSIALKEYGYNNQQVLQFTELTNKAMATGGSSAVEQSNALYQLSQALASGKLQGDEFRSMAEGSPIFLDIMSKSLGVTRGELRKMASDGKLTTDVIMKSILGQSEMIDKAFKKMPLTVGGALKQVKTSFMDLLDKTLVQTGVMNKLAEAVAFVGKHMGELLIVVGTVGAVMATNVIAPAMASAFALDGMAMAAMNAARAMVAATFSNPFTAVIAAAGIAALALYEFKDATIEVGDEQTTLGEAVSTVWEGIKVTISDAIDSAKNAVTEAVSGILEWFGKPAVTWEQVWSGIKATASAVAAAIYNTTGIGLAQNIISAFEWLASRAKAIINSIVAGASAAVDAVRDAASALGNFDFSGAADSIANAGDRIKDAMKNAYDTTPVTEFKWASEKAAKSLGEIYDKGKNKKYAAGLDVTRESRRGSGGDGGASPAHASGGGGGGGKKSKGGGGGGSKSEKSNMSAYNDDLETQKRAYELSHELRTMNISDEIAYWASKKATVKAGSKDALEIQKKIAELTYQDSKESIKRQMELDEVKRNHDQKVALENIDIALSEAKYKKEQGEISGKELLAIEEALENQRTEILKNGILARIKLLEKDPTKNAVELAKLNNEIEDLEREHQQKINDIQHKASEESKKRWDGVRSSMESLWDKGIDAMMNGTLTFKNAMKAIWADLGKAFAKVGFNMAKDWIKTNATQLLSTKMTHMKTLIAEKIFGAKKLATATATAAKERTINAATQNQAQGGIFGTLKAYISAQLQKLAQKLGFLGQEKVMDTTAAVTEAAMNKAKILGAAALGAANGIASFAAAPWPINIGAPAFGAGIFAATSAYAAIPSARGGYVIPRGVNPLTQLHEEEMVLPKAQANVINRLAQRSGGGASGGGGTGNVHHSVTVNMTDPHGSLSDEQLRRKGRVIADIVRQQTRNFNLKKS